MHPTIELAAHVQRDRERQIEHDRLAHLLACTRACCSPSIVDRLARALRPASSAC